ncbi:MAG: TlpA family protein disulfide reductase [Candidatus Krumholzibacteria bacterium]|nr:TlpA family protein disulfide reductase [Candidatus Krumholzibacteria bacterium]
MNRTFTIMPALILTLALLAACGEKKDEPTPEETTLTAVGQKAPDFTVPTIFGSPFKLSDHKGKVVLVNWFATWCPPCVEEMPHLQKDVWEKFRGPDFTMVSIAREETLQVVRPFVLKNELTWPVALDVTRKAYAKYADAYIPRTQVIDREGTIIFQSQGFEKKEFAKMIEVIRKEIDSE